MQFLEKEVGLLGGRNATFAPPKKLLRGQCIVLLPETVAVCRGGGGRPLHSGRGGGDAAGKLWTDTV